MEKKYTIEGSMEMEISKRRHTEKKEQYKIYRKGINIKKR